jgi:integrase
LTDRHWRRSDSRSGRGFGGIRAVRRCSPETLSGSEVSRLLDATTSLKYRAIFMLAYGSGLRISEVVSRELARRNRALVFDLLLKSAAGALLTLSRDPKWFGGSAQHLRACN